MESDNFVVIMPLAPCNGTTSTPPKLVVMLTAHYNGTQQWHPSSPSGTTSTPSKLVVALPNHTTMAPYDGTQQSSVNPSTAPWEKNEKRWKDECPTQQCLLFWVCAVWARILLLFAAQWEALPKPEFCCFTELCFFPASEATGLHNVHPTWAGTFVLVLLEPHFRAKTFSC